MLHRQYICTWLTVYKRNGQIELNWKRGNADVYSLPLKRLTLTEPRSGPNSDHDQLTDSPTPHS